MVLFLLFLTVCSQAFSQIDLETPHSFFIETKKIEIPGYPNAFNPSIIRWKGRLLLSFRIQIKPFRSRIGLVWLNDEFEPIGKPQMLETRSRLFLNKMASQEDARLVQVGETLYLVYNEALDLSLKRTLIRMEIAELFLEGSCFKIQRKQKFMRFEGTSYKRPEKNWTPFNYKGALFFAYSLEPYHILQPLSSYCKTIVKEEIQPDWKWGELRGGTPALKISEEEYLSFFHSKKLLKSPSLEKEIFHYFIGVYTFSTTPPFSIKRISKEPIVGKEFYSTPHPCLFGLSHVVFPGGFLIEQGFFWLAYGKKDCEVWVAKLDQKQLLATLHSL